jgi:hypothetical protein
VYYINTIPKLSSIIRRPFIPIEAAAAYTQYPFLIEQQRQQRSSHRKELPPAPKNKDLAATTSFAGEVAKHAVEGAAAWLSQSKELKDTADNLMNPPDAKAVIKQVQSIVDHMNQLKDTYKRSADFLNPTLAEMLDPILNNAAANQLGISLAIDGTWDLDASRLTSLLSEQPDEVNQVLTQNNGIASRIHSFLAGLEQLPTEALLRFSAPGFQSFTIYQLTKKPVLQLQLNGLLINSVM